MIISAPTNHPRTGCGLPPEMRGRLSEGGQLPACSTAEMASIASIHPEYQSEEENQFQRQQSPSVAITTDSEKTYGLYDTLLGRKSSGQTTYQPQQSIQTHPTIADSLKHREASGHEDIQNLAEHYKGRSR